MNENRQCPCEVIECGDTIYRIRMQKKGDCYTVFATPCNLPSAVFEICQICERQNSCTQFEYYECMILTDPVVTIIDCNLCNCIKRALTHYIDKIEICPCNNNNGFFGFF